MATPGIAVPGSVVSAGAAVAPAGAQGIQGLSAPNGALSVFIETPGANTYVLDLDAPTAYVIRKISAKLTAGTCTATLRYNGTAITGANAVALSTTLFTATLNQAVAIGGTVDLVLSALTSAANLSVSVRTSYN